MMRKTLSLLIILTLAFTGVFADDHIVAPGELHGKLLGAAQARQSNVAKIERFLSNDYVQKAIKITGVDATKVSQAVSLLSDEELTRIAAKTSQIESNFAAGALNNQQITYILIALATAVIVLIIVKH
jgi:hypothetical protein